VSPEKFIYAEWHKWDKAVENFHSVKFNLRGLPLVYIIRKDDAPLVIMLDDTAYNVDPENCPINTAPLTGAVFKWDNVEVHKSLKSLIQGTEAWKWSVMLALRERYDGSAEGEHMNIMKADLKELYFKRQDTFPFKKYVKRLKEAYTTLEDLGQPKFEKQKVRTLLDHIMCPDDQVKACVHTARKHYKDDFAGACTYLASEIARIFPDKDPESQQYRTSSRDTSSRGKRCVATAAPGGHQHKKRRKENGVDISGTSCYYSRDKWNNLSSPTRFKLLHDPQRVTAK